MSIEFLRVIAILTGKGIGKDYTSQNTLGQLINVINANGYSEITGNTDVNLRNAINHGKVMMKKNPSNRICFFYTENNTPKCREMATYDFDKSIDNAFDMVSAVLLSVAMFLNNHLSLFKIDKSKKEYASFSLLAMRLSQPSIRCQTISDTGNSKQLNVEIEIDNTDRTYIAQIATMLSIMVYETYNDYEQYMFNFSNPRMMNGWVCYKNQEILDMINKNKTFAEVLETISKRKDFIVFDASTENIDLKEVKYFCFPNYNSEEIKINNIEDASVEDKKRLKAHLFIGDITDKEKIINIINQGISWLKHVKNPPSPTIPHKYGEMEADSIYINVYRCDTRGNKELFSSNDNFVCMVDYNLCGETTIKHGGIPASLWNQLYHEKIDGIQFAWREGKYSMRKSIKVGVNDPCPCGSGKKYKRCCKK